MDKKSKYNIVLAVMIVLMLFAGLYVRRLGNSIERPGIDCPKCGSSETLVVEHAFDEVKCLCADCKAKFSIFKAEDKDSFFIPKHDAEEDSIEYEYDDTLEEQMHVEIR